MRSCDRETGERASRVRQHILPALILGVGLLLGSCAPPTITATEISPTSTVNSQASNLRVVECERIPTTEKNGNGGIVKLGVRFEGVFSESDICRFEVYPIDYYGNRLLLSQVVCYVTYYEDGDTFVIYELIFDTKALRNRYHRLDIITN